MNRLLARGGGDDLRALLQQRGWHTDEEPTVALAQGYGRDLRDPFATDPAQSPTAEPPWLETAFLTARADLTSRR